MNNICTPYLSVTAILTRTFASIHILTGQPARGSRGRSVPQFTKEKSHD